MVDQNFVDRLAKALAERLLPQLHDNKPYPRLMNAKQAAAYLGRPSKASIYQLVHRGEIPFVRHGSRHLRFDRLALDRWVESETVEKRTCGEHRKRKEEAHVQR
jgi:excisionase family DNA binding protein